MVQLASLAAGVVPTLLTVVVCVGVPILLAVYLLRLRDRFRGTKDAQVLDEFGLPIPSKPPHKPKPGPPLWLWLVVGWGVLLIMSTHRPKQGEVELQNPLSALRTPLFVIPPVLLACYIASLFLRLRDPLVTRLHQKALSGELDEAIQELRELVESRPTAIRANALGTLYSMKKDWSNAYKYFSQAVELNSGRRVLVMPYLGSQAMALCHLGRKDEALALLEPLANSNNPLYSDLCKYGMVLTELDRFEEAQSALKRAELALSKLTVVGGSAQREILRQPLVDAAKRLETARMEQNRRVLDDL